MSTSSSEVKVGIGCLIFILIVVVGLASYPYLMGNRKFFDTGFTYQYADVHFPDGKVQTIEISKWMDYEGEQIQIWGKDGVVYLVSSFNTVLRSK